MDKKLKTDCDGHYHKCNLCTEKGTPDYCRYKAEKRRIIQNACGKVYGICQELSLPVSRMVWDQDAQGNWKGEIKGIDDYYYARRAAQSAPLPTEKGAKSDYEKRRKGGAVGRDPSCSRRIDFFCLEAAWNLRGVPKGRRIL